MISLFLYIIAAFGFAFAAGHSKISLPFRSWLYVSVDDRRFVSRARRWLVDLIECPACLSFWLGLVLPQPYVPRLVMGFALCGASFILGKVTGLIHDDADTDA